MAGTALPTRGEEVVRRFVGGFVLGAALVAAVALVALVFTGLSAHHGGRPDWTFVVEQELARVEGDLGAALDATVRLGAVLGAAEAMAETTTILSRFGFERLPPSEERGARLLTMDARGRLAVELAAWDERFGEIAAAQPATREAATRVLALLRWQAEGGELARALQYYETRVAAAVAARMPAPAATAPSTAE